MTAASDPAGSSYSVTEKRHYLMHAFDRMRRFYDYDQDTPTEDGEGGAVVLVDGPAELLRGSVSHRIASTTWDDSDYPLRVDDHSLDRYLRENFENKDGAPILADDGFTDTNYYFDIIHESEMEREYDIDTIFEVVREEEWGGRHRSGLSLSLHPNVEAVVLSGTDGAIRNFRGSHYHEYGLDDYLPTPRRFSGLPVPERQTLGPMEEPRQDPPETVTDQIVEEFEDEENGKKVEILED